MRQAPGTAPEIVGVLCEYIRRAAPAGRGPAREAGVTAAVEALLNRPWSAHVTLDLSGTDLSRLRLESADLMGATLRGATLRESSLKDADLREADLRTADLTAADLTRADLRGADLREATGLTAEALATARVDRTMTAHLRAAGC
jgi:hypothetical protein